MRMSLFKTILGASGALAWALAATPAPAATWLGGGGFHTGGFHTGGFHPGGFHPVGPHGPGDFHNAPHGNFGALHGDFGRGRDGHEKRFSGGFAWGPFDVLGGALAGAAVVGSYDYDGGYAGASSDGGGCVLYKVIYDKWGRVTGQRPVSTC